MTKKYSNSSDICDTMTCYVLVVINVSIVIEDATMDANDEK